LRFRLILAVNLCLFGGLAIGVAVDYRHQVAVQLADKRAALQEEAKTLLPAVRALRHHGLDVVQQYLDDVCDRMQAATSPGHHIMVRVGPTMLHARSHSQWTPEAARTLDQAASTTQTQITINGDTHVLASDTDQDVMVSVSESAATVMAAARRQMAWRSVAIGVMGLAIALVIDTVLLRMVTQPIGRLVKAVRSIAEGQTGVQTRHYHTTEFSFLAGEINLMSQALADVDRARRAEMDKARRIQAHLQPRPVACPGVEVAWRYAPATEVGGDFLGVKQTASGSLVLCVADVTGHGVPAAMGAAVLKALFDSATAVSDDPLEIVAVMNERFHAATLDSDFASLVLLGIDPRAGLVHYVSAGHEPSYLLRAGSQTAILESTGPLLGIDADSVWTRRTIRVSPNDRLVLVTDGLAEAFASDGESFGRDRLRKAIEMAAESGDAETAVTDIERAVSQFRGSASQTDDVTILAIRIVS
jgi:sigma-B regulation protein RsbU (phosphoserine phosphatase)